MLERILLNFAEDELRSFLPEPAINFVTSLTDSVGDEEESEPYKNKLASLVASMCGAEFIFNDSYRATLIGRLKPSLFIDLFLKNSDISEQQITSYHYDTVIHWAKNNLQEFSNTLGMEEEYKASTDSSTPIESIAYIEPKYPLYNYQQSISKTVFENFNAGDTRQLLHLPTGSGKTRTAINIAAEHLRENSFNLVLWLADREELCSQAFQEFQAGWRALGNRATTAYGFYSESDESLGGIDSGFIVAGLHKFLSIRKNDSRQLQLLYKTLFEHVTLVIFDEAHKSIAPEFKKVVEDFIGAENFNALLLGLTATPGRSFSPDGLTEEDKELSNFFHGNKVSMKVKGYLSPIDYLVEEEYLAKAEFKSLRYDHSGILAYELSDSGGAQTMKALASNRERNQRILSTIKDECDAGASVIVFACTVDHAVGLAAALSLMGVKAASIDSKFDTIESRRMKIQQYKQGRLQVLTNFNVLTAGFDAPITSVAVIAKPMNSLVQYLQMAGRAMRGFRSGGNKHCRVYTVMDDIPQFKSINIGFSYWNEMWQEEEVK